MDSLSWLRLTRMIAQSVGARRWGPGRDGEKRGGGWVEEGPRGKDQGEIWKSLLIIDGWWKAWMDWDYINSNSRCEDGKAWVDRGFEVGFWKVWMEGGYHISWLQMECLGWQRLISWLIWDSSTTSSKFFHLPEQRRAPKLVKLHKIDKHVIQLCILPYFVVSKVELLYQ